MTWNLPLVKKFWNERSHDPNDFRRTKVSRKEAAFFSGYEKFRSFGMGRNESNIPSPPRVPRPSTQKNSPPLLQGWN